MTPTENFELEPDHLHLDRERDENRKPYFGQTETTEEQKQFYANLRKRSELLERQKAKLIARMLRNMASAVENQFYEAEEGWDWYGEMRVDVTVNHGGPWQSGPAEEYGVFDAWVKFSVGPNAVWTDKLTEPFQTLEQWQETNSEYLAIQSLIDAYLNRAKTTA